jgi:hypothetical protein
MMTSAFRNVWLAIASIGLVLSLYVHLLSYFGVPVVQRAPSLWLLHLGIFVVILPFALVKVGGSKQERKVSFWLRLFKEHPPWVLNLVYVLFLYAIINFLVGLYLTSGGVPAIVNGQTVLASHSKILRVLSPQEFQYHQALAMRMFSGHWLLFYGIPCLYLAVGRRRQPPGPDPAP